MKYLNFCFYLSLLWKPSIPGCGSRHARSFWAFFSAWHKYLSSKLNLTAFQRSFIVSGQVPPTSSDFCMLSILRVKNPLCSDRLMQPEILRKSWPIEKASPKACICALVLYTLSEIMCDHLENLPMTRLRWFDSLSLAGKMQRIAITTC